VAWVQGKTEFGPRALGNRSLLANPTNPKIKDIINEKIKKRESFRPFAPIIMEDYYKDFFYQKYPSPFMTFVFKAKSKAVKEIPGVIHVDGTSRVQTVNEKQNSKIYELLKKFKEHTGVPVLLNTSLNINEPINNDPITAFETFTKSNIDILIMQNYVFYKKY
jgi:carbamoyltransferase